MFCLKSQNLKITIRDKGYVRLDDKNFVFSLILVSKTKTFSTRLKKKLCIFWSVMN
jgi:hypothetical protein